MKLMNKVRITMGVWGITCLVLVGIGSLSGIITKMPTSMAVLSIERNYIKLDSLSGKELENYGFFKSSILRNEQGLEASLVRTKKYLILVGVGNAIIFFVLAIFLPSMIKRLAAPKPRLK